MLSKKTHNGNWDATLAVAFVCILFVALATGCSSASTEETTRIAKTLDIKSGMAVADVGAGDGVLLPHLASLVGSSGKVFGTEIDPENLDKIRVLATDSDLKQIVAIQGTPEATGLADNCCDAIVTRMVYHHLTDPTPFIDSLRRSLKPDGRLLIIDFHPSLWMSSSKPEDLPEDRDGHGIAPELVIREVSAQGFELEQRYDDWPGPGSLVLDHFALLFVPVQ